MHDNPYKAELQEAFVEERSISFRRRIAELLLDVAIGAIFLAGLGAALLLAGFGVMYWTGID